MTDGPEAHLEALEQVLTSMPRAHRIAFAALLAERWLSLADVREAHRVLDSIVWPCAAGEDVLDRIPAARKELEHLAVMVDPDEFWAHTDYEAIRAVAVALSCCERGGDVDSTVDAGLFTLYQRTNTGPVPKPFGEQRDDLAQLSARWSRKEAREEVDFQLRVLDELSREKTIDGVALRDRIVGPYVTRSERQEESLRRFHEQQKKKRQEMASGPESGSAP